MQPAILVADDDPDQLEELAEALTRYGFRVVTARDGHEVIEVMTQERPRALITDVNMPHWDGVRAAEAARLFDHRVITVLVTGEDQAYHRASGADVGAVMVARKPLDIATIVPFLRDALGLREAS